MYGVIQQVAVLCGSLQNGVAATGDVAQPDDTVLVGGISSCGVLTAVAACDLKLNAAQRLAGDSINLGDQQATVGDVVEGECLGIIGIDNCGLAAGLGVDAVAVDGLLLSHNESAADIGENNLAVGIRHIGALGGELAALGVHIGAVSIGDLELDALQRFARDRIQLIDDEIALGLITELQSDRLACSDACGLRGIVQNVGIVLGAGLLDHQSRAGIDALNQDGACAVGDKFAVGVAHHSAVRGGHKELHIGQRLTADAVDLLDEQRTLGGVAEVQLHHILILAADIGGLGSGVDDVIAVTGQFLHDVGAFIQTGHGETAVCRSLIGSDDSTAGTGRASKVLHLEHGITDRFAGDRIELKDYQCAERSVLKGNGLAFASLDEHFLRGRVFDAVAGYRLYFGDFVPAVLQVGELELTVGIGIEIAKVVDLAALGIIAGIGHLELCALQRLARHAANLVDSQAGLLMVFKVNAMVAIGIEGYQLTGSIQQIRGRNGLFRDFIYAGKQILQFCTAVLSGADLIDTMAVSSTDNEYGIGDGFAGIRIVLINIEVGADLILNDQSAGLTGEQLHFVLAQVDDVVRHRRGLTHGIDPRLQIAYQNLTVFIGGAVKIMCSIFDLCNPEGYALQSRAIGAELDQLQRGLDAVGENKLGILVGVQLNDALGFVDDVARAGQFSYHIGAGRELAQVDLAVFVSSEFLGAVVASDRLDLKQHVWNDLGGVGAVNLHQT